MLLQKDYDQFNSVPIHIYLCVCERERDSTHLTWTFCRKKKWTDYCFNSRSLTTMYCKKKQIWHSKFLFCGPLKIWLSTTPPLPFSLPRSNHDHIATLLAYWHGGPKSVLFLTSFVAPLHPYLSHAPPYFSLIVKYLIGWSHPLHPWPINHAHNAGLPYTHFLTNLIKTLNSKSMIK